MRTRVRSRAAAIVLAVAIVAAGALPAGAAATWAVVASPSPVAPPTGAFLSMACPTTTVCFAVGSDGGQYSQIERWNGTTWSMVSFPRPAGATASKLAGVACPTSTTCFAVGTWQVTSSAQNTFIEQWNGTTWTVASSPNATGSLNILTAVTCASATSCFAVGENQNGTVQGTLIEQWDGSVWSVVPSPNPSGSTFKNLRGVACASATSCFAVGSIDAGASSTSFVEQWNGAAWTIVTVPTPAGATKTRLGGVSCPSATLCIAAGFAENDTATGRPTKTLVERWNGTTWAIMTSPNVTGVNSSVLNGLTCPTTTSCIAGGASSAVTGIVSDTNTLIERWNGTTWTIATTPNPVAKHGSAFDGAGCVTTTHCFAVGTEGSNLSLTEEWKGSTWAIDPPPSGSSQSQLTGVRCLTATNCYAVGFNETSIGYRTLIEHRNATTWAVQASPNAAGATDNFLYDAACATATNCFAVGVSRANAVPTMLLEHSSGTTWAIAAAPKPAGSDQTTLTSITCPAATSCFAVGYYDATGTKSAVKTLVEHWNGTKWAVQASPIHTGSTDTELAGVSCTAATRCFAVGSFVTSGGEATFAMRWNGSAWTATATPNSHPADRFTSVSCATASSCLAVGVAATNAVTEVTLAERWNGTAWAIVASPNTNGGGSQLLGVSCPATTTCFAAGHDLVPNSAGSTRTMIEKWNGTAWSVVTSPNQPGANASGLQAIICSSATLCRAVGYSATNANLHTLVEQYG